MDNLTKWETLLPDDTWKSLINLINKTNNMRKEQTIFPPKDEVLRALKLTDPYNIKAIIIGQDPYHGDGQANRLAFAVNSNITPPPSLKNIDTELFREYGKHLSSKTLTNWAEKQGVLLLNTSLTVEKGKPASHTDLGWQEITSMIVEATSWANPNAVILAWGRHAQEIAENAAKNLKTSPTIIKTTHPSPFSANTPAGNTPAFIGSNCFKKANEILTQNNISEINWFEI